MSGRERPLATVPGWLWALLGATLAAQSGVQALRPPPATAAADLPPAPRAAALRLASFGEPAALARLMMLWLQAFDLRGQNNLPYRDLDYARLTAWLRAIIELDPRSEYPLFSAARLYAQNPDRPKSLVMLVFVYEEYLKDPNRRWPWFAHAALVTKHRLGDLPLARRYAAAIDRHTTAENAPSWARQMEIFIIEDMNDHEAHKVMLGGLLASDRIRDPAERRFLQGRLEEMEQRTGTKPRP